MTIDLQGGPKK